MKKQQLLIIIIALLVVAGLYFFGETVGPKKPSTAQNAEADEHNHDSTGFDIEHFKQESFEKLPIFAQNKINDLEAGVKRGDVKNQQISLNKQLSAYWVDSLHNPIMHFYYLTKWAELDNNEKNLTFAAHSILGQLQYVDETGKQSWMASQGKKLFEMALAKNATNDSSIVGLGGCIMYGGTTGTNDNPMEGILKVRAVAEKDSNNMFAQYMLGIGGVQSKQYDKAIIRFEKVVKAQPNNMEMLFKLAETCEMAGNKEKAIFYYEVINKKVSVPEAKKEIEARIETLKK